MGVLRLMLALTVVIAHSQPFFGFKLVGGLLAVQSFYIISGFYMALVLNEKYVGANYYKTFLFNRFLRLFPTYWVVLMLTLVTTLISWHLYGTAFKLSQYINHYSFINAKSLVYLLFSNIFIFGQDAVLFLRLNPLDGTLEFVKDFRVAGKPFPALHEFLFVPQAWSIGIELSFYLIAPFLVKRKLSILLMVIGVSLLLRFYLYKLGLHHDPWTYRFFPTELALFVLGAVAYKIYKKFRSIEIYKKWLVSIFCFVVCITLFYQFIYFSTTIVKDVLETKMWIYYSILVVAIPFMFIFTKDIKLDNRLGELSYPVYISHIFVLRAIPNYVKQQLLGGELTIYLVSLVMIILISLCLVHFVEKPIEKLRQKRVKKMIITP